MLYRLFIQIAFMSMSTSKLCFMGIHLGRSRCKARLCVRRDAFAFDPCQQLRGYDRHFVDPKYANPDTAQGFYTKIDGQVKRQMELSLYRGRFHLGTSELFNLNSYCSQVVLPR